MVLHNFILKFDFEYLMVILRQYSKKNYRKIPKSSKIYIKCHIDTKLPGGLIIIEFCFIKSKVVEYQSKGAYFNFWFLNLVPPEPIYHSY